MRIATFSAFLIACTLVGFRSHAAEPELVGALAMLTEDAVSDQLGLSESQRQALLQLVDDREMAGMELALQTKSLSVKERTLKLSDFRSASVRQGLALLTDAQRSEFAKLRAVSDDPLMITPAADSASDSSSTTDSQVMSTVESKVKPESSTTPQNAPTDEAAAANPPPGPDAGSDQRTAETNPSSLIAKDGQLSFNFRYQPWKDVLDWFAQQADLSLVLESAPPGTFNYQDTRSYTIGQALDVLNGVLQTKGYTLVRKDRMLLLINNEDGIPPNLVTDVPLSQLDQHGEYELIRVLFRVRNMLPADAAEELQQMMGPQGKILVLPKAGMIQVTETAGRIRTLRSVIEAIEEPVGSNGAVHEFALKYLPASEVLPVLRQMLGIPADAMSTPTGSLQLAVDPLGVKLFAQGSGVQLRRMEEVLRLVDVAEAAAGAGLQETPQLEVYSVAGIDPELVLDVLQTILAGNDATRLATDMQTGNLVALATPTEHATIRATLQQMQQDQRQITVIPLDTVDPQLAVLSINKLFAGQGTSDEPDPRAPIVDADLTSRSLLVRASPSQIRQIEEFLQQLGDGQASASSTTGGNVRMLPITPAEARTALTQVQQLWPMLRPNRIRVVTPSAAIPAYKPSDSAAPPEDPLEQLLGPGAMFGIPPASEPPVEPNYKDRSAARDRVPARFAAQDTTRRSEPSPEPTASKPGAEIFVAPGPGGTVIASADLEALDAFEQLLRNSASMAGAGGRQFAVFYLKYAEAAAAAETLSKVFGGGGGGGNVMEDLAGAALGGLGGGLMGDLLGLGGGGDAAGGFASTAVDIIPDARLNALVVYAQPADLDTIDQLLRVLDQRTGPEPVEAGGKARLIPVVNTSAAAVAEVVQQVFQDRIQSSGKGGGGQPSPEDLIRALRRGGGAGGGGSEQEPSKMSIGIDTRSNSLVVRAPDPLFDQVKQLVEQLDQEGIGTPQSTRIVSLQHTNTSALREALSSLLGEAAVTSSVGNSGSASPASGTSSRSRQNSKSNATREMMQRMEMLRRMRDSMQRGQGSRRGADRGSRPSGNPRSGGGR